MRLNLFANKSKVKVLKKMVKKIEGKTGPFGPEENLHLHSIEINEKINEKEKNNMKKK